MEEEHFDVLSFLKSNVSEFVEMDSLFSNYIAFVLDTVNFSTPSAFLEANRLISAVLASIKSNLNAKELLDTIKEEKTKRGLIAVQKTITVKGAMSAQSLAEQAKAQREAWVQAQKQETLFELSMAQTSALAEAQMKKRAAKRGENISTARVIDEEANIITNTKTLSSVDIDLQHVSLTIGGKQLLDDASVKFVAGGKYGLIGENGIGKSVFLKALSKRQLPVPPNLSITYVAQELAPSNDSVLDTVLMVDTRRTELMNSEKELIKLLAVFEQDATEELLHNHGVDLKKYWPEQRDADFYPSADMITDKLNKVYEDMNTHDIFGAESRASAILKGLQFNDEDFTRKVKEFSGGYRQRMAIARAIYSNPDVLILDEPHNHLDLASILYLEHWMKNVFENTLIVVSHHISTLNNVCNSIVRLHGKKLTTWKGNFDTFIKTFETEQLNTQRRLERQERDKAHLQKFIDRFRANAKRATQAQSRMKLLKSFENIELDEEESQFTFTFPPPARLAHGDVYEVENLTFSYENSSRKIVDNVSFKLKPGEKVCLLGSNGQGKTTLVKLLTGELKPNSGIIARNSGIKIAYYNQTHAESLPMDLTALECLHQSFPGEDSQTLRNWLGRFAIGLDLQNQVIRTCSGGERARISLALMTFNNNANVLVLDEPTNHMSLQVKSALYNAFSDFEGAILAVTHDETLIDTVCDRILEVSHGRITEYDTFEEYSSQLKKTMNI